MGAVADSCASQAALVMTTAGSTTTPRRARPACLSGVMSPASGSVISPWQERTALNMHCCAHRLDITTNNPATQVFTAFFLDLPRKKVHGGPSLNYTSFSGVAIEQEGYLDAINTPEWGVDQICAYV